MGSGLNKVFTLMLPAPGTQSMFDPYRFVSARTKMGPYGFTKYGLLPSPLPNTPMVDIEPASPSENVIGPAPVGIQLVAGLITLITTGSADSSPSVLLAGFGSWITGFHVVSTPTVWTPSAVFEPLMANHTYNFCKFDNGSGFNNVVLSALARYKAKMN